MDCRKRFQTLRYRNDSLSFAGIHPIDASVIERQKNLKRKTLYNAVKIVPQLNRKLFASIEKVREKLVPEITVEASMYNQPQTQAYGFGIGRDKISIALSSGILNLMTLAEIEFIIGHEIGHYIMEHDTYPSQSDTYTDIEKLNLLALRRATEISADRIAYLACEDRKDAFSCLFKLVSGVPDTVLKLHIDAYLKQTDELITMGGLEADIQSDHPIIAARMRALLWFEQSELLYTWKGLADKPTLTTDELYTLISKDLAAVGGFKLEAINENALQSALLWGIIAVFVVDLTISDAEKALLNRTFGEKAALQSIDYVQKHGLDGVIDQFDNCVSNVHMMPHAVREALFADILTFGALASGPKDLREKILTIISHRLGLRKAVTLPDTMEETPIRLQTPSVYAHIKK